MKSQHRPLGVTIIAILTIIRGGHVTSRWTLIALGTLISVNPSGRTTSTTTDSHPVAQVFGVVSAAIGSILSRNFMSYSG